MIIGCSGVARSGKDTVANYLVKEYGFKRAAFATALNDYSDWDWTINNHNGPLKDLYKKVDFFLLGKTLDT